MTTNRALRVVLDTSVLIAGLRSRKGASAVLMELLLSGSAKLLLDYRVASEYRDVLFRREHRLASGLSADDLDFVLRNLESIAVPVDIRWRYRPLSTDPDDDRILDLAINGSADIITTMNLRHIELPAARFGIRTLAPGDLLATIREGGRDVIAQ